MFTVVLVLHWIELNGSSFHSNQNIMINATFHNAALSARKSNKSRYIWVSTLHWVTCAAHLKSPTLFLWPHEYAYVGAIGIGISLTNTNNSLSSSAQLFVPNSSCISACSERLPLWWEIWCKHFSQQMFRRQRCTLLLLSLSGFEAKHSRMHMPHAWRVHVGNIVNWGSRNVEQVSEEVTRHGAGSLPPRCNKNLGEDSAVGSCICLRVGLTQVGWRSGHAHVLPKFPSFQLGKQVSPRLTPSPLRHVSTPLPLCGLHVQERQSETSHPVIWGMHDTAAQMDQHITTHFGSHNMTSDDMRLVFVLGRVRTGVPEFCEALGFLSVWSRRVLPHA